VCVRARVCSACELWYYPYMEAGRHYVDVTEWPEARAAVLRYAANPKERLDMVKQVQKWSNDAQMVKRLRKWSK
jgi:hypothetical protein